jgi:hypothetical protein
MRLVKRYRYEPYNLGRYPADEMSERGLDRQLKAIGKALAKAAPLLPNRLTPEVVLKQLVANGEEAWAEQRWIDDYRAFLAQ